MIRQFFPGDWVRLKADIKKVRYPLLWRMVARNKRECPLVVHEVIIDDSLSVEYIKVHWANGKLSGALYASIFEKASE